MITTYLDSDMNSDGIPLPSPSKAPEHVTETADTAKPQLMYLRAVTPIFIVSDFLPLLTNHNYNIQYHSDIFYITIKLFRVI